MKINLASTRLAFVLIAFLITLILISAIIPQQGIAESQIVDWHEWLGESYVVIVKLGLDRIYYTPAFFIVLGLLAINLTAGNIRRFRIVYRTDKNLLRLRHLGSIIFHLSLLIIIASAILHFLYKYEGVFAITEGQTVEDNDSSYFREFKGPLSDDRYGQFRLRLDSLQSYLRDDPSFEGRAIITMTPSDGEKMSARVETNHPFRWRDTDFHFGSNTGFSPEILLMNDSGESLFRSFVRVSHRKENGRDIHHDLVDLPPTDWRLSLELLAKPGQPLDDVAVVTIVESAAGALINDTLRVGDTTSFAGYQLVVPQLRRWCYIGVMRNPFLNLLFFGFWSALAGMTLGLIPRLFERCDRT